MCKEKMIDSKTKAEIETELEKILKLLDSDRVQMFDCEDMFGDTKQSIYSNDEVDVLFAPGYDYVELIGFNEEDYNYFFKKYGY